MWSSPVCGAGGPGVLCQLGSMAPGATQTVTAAIHLPIATSSQNYSIQATAAAASPNDPVSGNASFVDSFTVPAANSTIATSTVSMPRDGTIERKQEVAAGDAIADAFRETYSTDFGFVQGGAIRSGITCNVSSVGATYCPNTGGPPFAITRGAVLSTLPFFNRVDTYTISGTELWAMLEKSVGSYPTAFAGFLQVSGLCFTWDESEAASARVLSVVRQNANGTCSATAIPADATQYTVAQTNFETAGANGYPDFSSRATHRGYDADVFTEWAIAHSPLNPAGGRNTRVP
jgi:2',3'-cyclic-nucleotide 2'-phosphodiesterase (5'-nucleotidase family)